MGSPYDGFTPRSEMPAGERTRTIWEGRCPTCGENGCVPDSGNSKIIEMSRWCAACQKPVDCAKISYTGPELEPTPPNVHHIWCNGQKGPVKGCRWCCYLDKEGHWDGMWFRYPYDPATGPAADFAEQHFPEIVRRA